MFRALRMFVIGQQRLQRYENLLNNCGLHYINLLAELFTLSFGAFLAAVLEWTVLVTCLIIFRNGMYCMS